MLNIFSQIRNEKKKKLIIIIIIITKYKNIHVLFTQVPQLWLIKKKELLISYRNIWHEIHNLELMNKKNINWFKKRETKLYKYKFFFFFLNDNATDSHSLAYHNFSTL